MTSLIRRLEVVDQGLADAQATTADLQMLHSEVVRSLTNGLVIVDVNGQVMDINPEGCSLLGISGSPAIIGGPVTRWFPGLRLVGDTRKEKENRTRDIARRENGEELPVEYAITPLISHGGAPRGFVLSFNDLSRVRILEQELEQSRRLAALGELSATFAHEVRNPLSAVSGAFQLLSSAAAFSDDDRTLVAIAGKETARIERLVNDLLQYTRPRTPDRNRCDVAQIAREVLDAFVLGQDEDLVVIRRCDESVPAEVDPFQIKQVLWNLLRNAAQAVEGNGTVELEVAPDKNGVRIRVSDNGPGIPVLERNRVFEPFVSTRRQGMGLGLAICARIIRDHDGSIEIGDATRGGAEFQIWLPLRDAGRKS
jgi:two-component system sensor histidine kinase PilS (NtrC family)